MKSMAIVESPDSDSDESIIGQELARFDKADYQISRKNSVPAEVKFFISTIDRLVEVEGGAESYVNPVTMMKEFGGRINEIAMRLALICALSRDPNTKIIADIDMIWATNYMRKQFSEMVAMVQKYMRSSNTDADTMEMVDAIKRHGLSGVKRSQLIRDCPIFRKYTKDQTERLLANAIEAGMITTQTVSTGGRPTVIYYA